MEDFKSNKTEQINESQAEALLEELLNDPEYDFLNKIKSNHEKIENADTAREALAFANAQIEEREKRTFRFVPVGAMPGIIEEELAYDGFRKSFKSISRHKRLVGEGGDAFVYFSNDEKYKGISKACYKFSKIVGTNRGRNSMEQELDMHKNFYQVLQASGMETITIPQPFYYTEMGSQKMIAMERLQARSIDDLKRGFGSLPTWVTAEHIDLYCDEVKRALDVLHAAGLYHRDLHFGNLMFTQSPTETQNLGHIIDFGLSAEGQDGLEPYKKTTQSEVFTFDDDYGRVEAVRVELHRLKRSS